RCPGWASECATDNRSVVRLRRQLSGRAGCATERAIPGLSVIPSIRNVHAGLRTGPNWEDIDVTRTVLRSTVQLSPAWWIYLHNRTYSNGPLLRIACLSTE